MELAAVVPMLNGLAAIIVVLGLALFCHELGHFLAAKAFNCRVDDFALGFGPSLLAKRHGETTYRLNVIPFGGYVRIAGMEPGSEDVPRGFYSIPRYYGAIILVAGVTMNVVLAIVMYSIVALGQGVPDPNDQSIIVGKVMSGSAGERDGLMMGDVFVAVNGCDRSLKLVQVEPGGPAYKAGLHAGDLISEIDGKKVDEYTAQEAAANLRGEPGTTVKLLVHRGNSSFTVEVVREIVEIPTVRFDMIDDIGYMQILEFTPVTPEKVKEAVTDFTENGYSAIIMDLRSNPGGSVDSAVQIADLFLSSKTVLIMESGKQKETSQYRTRSGETVPPEIPLIVLTNGGTASSSEILAGALRDNGRTSAIIGETTFGKGLVQNVYPFDDDDYFKITSAQYFTPNGNDIHEIGIVPDIEIVEPELTDEELEDYARIQDEKLIQSFTDAHEEFIDEEVDAFILELQESGIILERRLLRKLIRNSFETSMDFPPIYDLEYDDVLNRAIEFIREGE